MPLQPPAAQSASPLYFISCPNKEAVNIGLFAGGLQAALPERVG